MDIFTKKGARVESRKEKNSSVPSINFSAALVVACLRPAGYWWHLPAMTKVFPKFSPIEGDLASNIWRSSPCQPQQRALSHPWNVHFRYIYTTLWALELFFEPICRYSTLYCRSHFSGQNIIQNNIFGTIALNLGYSMLSNHKCWVESTLFYVMFVYFYRYIKNVIQFKL